MNKQSAASLYLDHLAVRKSNAEQFLSGKLKESTLHLIATAENYANELNSSDRSESVIENYLLEIDGNLQQALHNVSALNDIDTGKIKRPGDIYTMDKLHFLSIL